MTDAGDGGIGEDLTAAHGHRQDTGGVDSVKTGYGVQTGGDVSSLSETQTTQTRFGYHAGLLITQSSVSQ